MNHDAVVEAFPLYWPPAWPRTKRPQRSRFKQAGRFGFVRDKLIHEVYLLGGRKTILSTNIPLRQDGLPYARTGRIEDVGVAVYFTLRGSEVCFPCDRWDRIEDNAWAIACSVEALRGLERWGAKTMVDAAFRGFKRLPEAGAGSGFKWWEVLGVAINASRGQIEAAYRDKAWSAHPDHGGTTDQMAALNEAKRQALAARPA